MRNRRTGEVSDGWRVVEDENLNYSGTVYMERIVDTKYLRFGRGWMRTRDHFDFKGINFGIYEFEPVDWDEFDDEITTHRLK